MKNGGLKGALKKFPSLVYKSQCASYRSQFRVFLLKIFVSLGVFVASFCVWINVAYAEDSFKYFSGATSQPEGVIYNGGSLDFNATQDLDNGDDNTDPLDFSARINEFPMEGDEYSYLVDGWVWNTNLGWMSFYCDDDRSNRGISCGGYPYMVYADTQGFLYGYMWSTVGWVRLDWWCTDSPPIGGSMLDAGACPSTSNPSGPFFRDDLRSWDVPRIDIYGSEPDSNSGDVHGYAWSPAVGWVSFEGTSAPWKPLYLIFTFEIVDEDGENLEDMATDRNKVPFADGIQKLTLRVNAEDRNATQANSITIDNLIFAGAVHIGQIDEDDDGADDDTATALIEGDFSNSMVDSKLWSGRYIQSKAPTDNVNYVTFDFTDYYMKSNLENSNNYLYSGDWNYYRVTEIKVTAVLGALSVTRTLEFRDGSWKGAKHYDHIYLFDGDLKFRPVYEITSLTNDRKTYIEARRNQPFIIDVEKECKDDDGVDDCDDGKVEFELDDKVGSNFNYVFDKDANGVYDSVSEDEKYEKDPLTGLPSSFSAMPYWEEGMRSEAAEITSPFLTSVVTDKGSGATYYSNKMPLDDTGLLLNPVIEVEGVISAGSGVTNPQIKDRPFQTVGMISPAIARGEILRNIKSATMGMGGAVRCSNCKMWLDNIDRDGDGVGDGWSHDNSGDLGTVEYKELLDGKLIYVKGGNLLLEKGENWTGGYTLVLMGGDLYLTNNLYTTDSAAQLGIVVLGEKDAAGNMTGGNMYVSSNVTDIYANMFMDGGFFRYDKDNWPPDLSAVGTGSGKKIPIFAGTNTAMRIKKRQDKLINQLYIKGSLSSANTIGGIDRNPKVNGYGERLSGAGALEEATAFDLNFLSYFRAEPDPLNSTWVSPEGFSQTVLSRYWDFTNPSNPTDKLVPTYFIYDPPAPGVPIFTTPAAISGSEQVNR